MAKAKRIPIPPLTDEMYERGVGSAKDGPFDVVSARYDRKADALELVLRKGISVCFPREQIREIKNASPADVAKVEVQPGGDGISFLRLDVDISVPGLLADELGPLFAKGFGRKSLGATSEKKAASSRENGRKGGRPKSRSSAA